MSQVRVKILIVDDSPTGRETLGALLYSPEYELHFAANGQEALEKAVEVIPDLILLDVMMPDMDGFEVCQRIRKHDLLAEVPVIMVTALNDRKSRLQSIRAGADDFISKPFDTAELGARVQMIARLNRYRRLHDERRHFEQIIQFSPDGIAIVDEDGLIYLANQTLLKLLRTEEEEQIRGRSLVKFLLDERAISFLGDIKQVISGSKQIVQAESTLKGFDDTLLPVELAMGRFDWDGRSMAQINIRDLTQRKQAEAAVRESERRYRNIFETAPVAIIEEDYYEVFCAIRGLKKQGMQDMRAYLDDHPEFVKQMAETVMIREMNAYAETLFRVNPIDSNSTNLDAVFFPESLDRFKKVLLAIANGVDHCEVENIQKTLDGERRHVLVSMSFPQKPEQFHSVLVSIVDITSLKQTEAALRESEERYHKMMQMANDAIFVVNERTLQLVDVNDKAQQLVGWDRDTLLSMRVFDLYPPEDQQRCRDSFNTTTREDQYPAAIREILDCNGKRIIVEISSSRIELGSKTLSLGTFRDITERSKQERVREAMLTVSVELRKTAERSEMLQIILDQLLLILNADCAVISRDEEGTSIIDLASGNGFSSCEEQWLPAEFKSKWDDERPYAICNQMEERPALPWLEKLAPEAAVLQAPLITHEKILGSLWVGRELAWDDTDGRILASVADLAANAIQRVTFREELERRLEYLQALSRLDKAIAGSLDINLIFRVLLEQVSAQLKVDAVDVLLFRPEEKKLEYADGIGFRVPLNEHELYWDYLKFAKQVVTTGQLVQITDLGAVSGEKGISPTLDNFLDTEGFKSYYGVPLKAKGEILGVLELFHRQVIHPDDMWIDFLLAVADQGAIAISQTHLFDEMQKANSALTVAYDETIVGWALALELRDNETQGHSQRVTDLAVQLAKSMGVSGEDLVNLRRGAILHDIGKMGVPDSILHKPAKLDADEWEIMKMHPVYAYNMLLQIEFLRDALDIPLYHHERWDGSGYPEGLKGTQIPLSARIFAIIDVWDAVTNDRPYRNAWTRDEALAHIRSEEGKHFDPDVLQAFLQILDLVDEGCGD